MKSLAEGGFQVGEFAKLCYGIGAERTVKTLEPADAIRQTKELLTQDNVNIAEAAFLKDNMFVRAFYVDDICDKIIAGEYEEQQEAEFMMGMGFKAFVEMMAVDYCKHIKTDCIIGSKCFKCPFHKKANDKSDKLDGYSECWIDKAGFDPSAPTKPLIKDMSGQYIGTKREEYVKGNKYFMEDLTEYDLKRHGDSKHPGLDHYERKWLHIGVATHNKEALKDYSCKMDGDTYLDIAGLKNEMSSWKFPLHFIDFETSAVALPFYDKMRPYEQIAFQFSHHGVDLNEDGTTG